MFIKDEEALGYVAVAVLLVFPWLGVAWKTWGFIWSLLMLLAVFLVGRKRGFSLTALISLVGYGILFIVYGTSAWQYVSFVPLAGLLSILGWHKRWPMKETFFWSAALAAALGALVVMPYMPQGTSVLPENEIIEAVVEQYNVSGGMAMLQQQGFSELQLRELLQRGLELYVLIQPGIAALFAILKFGIVFFLMELLFRKKEERIPFVHWRLPWYAVWGAVLGLAFYLTGDQFSWVVLRTTGINLMVIYGGVTLVLGTAVLVYYLQSPKLHLLLKVLLVAFCFFYFYLGAFILMMCGLFDLVFNFRRLPEEI